MISFGLTRAQPVRLHVHDASGRIVARLVDGALPAGQHQVLWNGYSDVGLRAAAGVYFVRLTAPAFSEVQRLTVLR